MQFVDKTLFISKPICDRFSALAGPDSPKDACATRTIPSYSGPTTNFTQSSPCNHKLYSGGCRTIRRRVGWRNPPNGNLQISRTGGGKILHAGHRFRSEPNKAGGRSDNPALLQAALLYPAAVVESDEGSLMQLMIRSGADWVAMGSPLSRGTYEGGTIEVR